MFFLLKFETRYDAPNMKYICLLTSIIFVSECIYCIIGEVGTN